MTETSKDKTVTPQADMKNSPAAWDTEMLEKNWQDHLKSLIVEQKTALPLKRLQFQTQQEPIFKDVTGRWAKMTSEERNTAWDSLLAFAQKNIKEMLPTCVSCGTCCKKGSPTLTHEDLALLREEHIPWSSLVTLREGEPVHSPYTSKQFYLENELIKIKEDGTPKACIFLDRDTDSCTIYQNRPAQCRAQACWDPEPAKELEEIPRLTRRDLFANVTTLLEILSEHDRRCSFDQMRSAFDELQKTKGENIAAVVDLLEYDDHFRKFVAEKLRIPGEALDLVFGRPLATRVKLFGFRLDVVDEGTPVLVPDRE